MPPVDPGLNAEQQRNLRVILGVGRSLGATTKVLKAAVESGLVESNLRNLSYGDRDSRGVFQQRPSQGWGSPAQVTNVHHAAAEFFRRAIPLASRYAKSGDLAAAVQRPAPQFAGRYGQQSGEAQSLLAGLGGGGAAPSAPSAGPPSLSVSGSSGAQLAAALTSVLQQQPKPQVPLTPLASPAFAAHPVLAGQAVPQVAPASQPSSDPLSAALASIQGLTGPTAKVTAGALPASPGGGGGSIKVAAGAERPGHFLQSPVKGLLRATSGILGEPLTVTTGTNHNKFVAGEGATVSDHWDGNAADLGLGGDARSDPKVAARGDSIAAAALQSLGVPQAKAIAEARKGGVFTINRNGVRYQVLWRTLVGGNHYNHVHVGAAPH